MLFEAKLGNDESFYKSLNINAVKCKQGRQVLSAKFEPLNGG